MKIRVVCSVCDGVFDWKWGKSKGTCEHCDTDLNVRQVKMAQGEIIKLFQ